MHRELVLRPDAALLLPALADAFDEPFADSSALPTYLVSQLAAEDVKVALSGEGGDELFGGYYTYAADLFAQRSAARRRGTAARRAAADVDAQGELRLPREALRACRASAAARAAPRLEGDLLGRRPRGAHRAGDRRSIRVDLLRERFAETEGAPLLARLQDVDLGTYLVDDLLVKTDRASMAHSLEARVPFLDSVVTGFALALPTRHKVRGLSKKRLLRKAAEPLLPRADRARPQARLLDPGRRVARAGSWSRSRATPCRRTSCAGRASSGREPVRRLLDEHVAGKQDWSRQLWGLLAFTLWYERHVEHPPTVAQVDEVSDKASTA